MTPEQLRDILAEHFDPPALDAVDWQEITRAIIPIIQADERERANPFEGTTFETRDERTEREAEQLYRKSTANDPVIHCNRFPVWEELREESRQEWRDRAIRERNGHD